MAFTRNFVANVVKFWGAPDGGDATNGVGGRETLAATGYSQAVPLAKNGGRVGLHIQWDSTGTPTGAFTVQYSLLPRPNEANDNDWVTDTGATVIGTSLTVAGAAGNSVIMVGNTPPGGFVRLKWTRTSGSLDVVGYAANASIGAGY